MEESKICRSCRKLKKMSLSRLKKHDYICASCTNEERAAYRREYFSRPEVIERQKVYRKRLEVIERHNESNRIYNQKPETKKKRREYMREYRKRPGIMKKHMKACGVYNQKTETKKRNREYMRRYRQRLADMKISDLLL